MSRRNATRKRVFVCSPLSGDVERNVALARDLTKAVIEAGHSPFTPHLFYTMFLDDQIEADRNAGIACGKAWLRTADEMWMYADERAECSRGMAAELDFAEKLVIPPAVIWMPPEWAPFKDRIPRKFHNHPRVSSVLADVE